MDDRSWYLNDPEIIFYSKFVTYQSIKGNTDFTPYLASMKKVTTEVFK